MDINKIFKNPLFMGLLAFGLSYGFLYWQNKKKAEVEKNTEQEPVKLNIPIIVGVVIMILTYFLFKTPGNIPPMKNNIPSAIPINPANPLKNCEVVNEFRIITDSLDSGSFRLIGKNAINLPGEDVFIDIGRF